MGYFSNLAIERTESQDDACWSTAQWTLLSRLDDLEAHRRELIDYRIDNKESWGLSDADLRYVLPQDLYTLSEVNRAMMIAEGDFWKSLGIRWGLYANEAPEEPKKAVFNIPGQITIYEYLKELETAA